MTIAAVFNVRSLIGDPLIIFKRATLGMVYTSETNEGGDDWAMYSKEQRKAWPVCAAISKLPCTLCPGIPITYI